MTYTFAALEVSGQAYWEIRKKLEVAGYEDQFIEDKGRIIIDMHGIALGTSKGLKEEVMVSIPAFRENSKCTKCGCADVSLSYHEVRTVSIHSSGTSCGTGEHVDKKCKRCGYVWSEQCLLPVKSEEQDIQDIQDIIESKR